MSVPCSNELENENLGGKTSGKQCETLRRALPATSRPASKPHLCL
jgi:hypothetical protein